MSWQEIKTQSFKKDRTLKVPLQIVEIKELHQIKNASELLQQSPAKQNKKPDNFITTLKTRLANSDTKSIYIFVPGFKADFTYPVLVAAELWYYMGYPGAFIAYSWPSGQKLRDYLSDMETTAFTAQHFRMLLRYLANETDVDNIHILSYSAGARIVSQALHELRLMTQGFSKARLEKTLKINQVIFAAPDIDMMLFGARYRDGFEDIAKRITIYTNANDTALNWALRFFGWPRLGAPGEMGLTPEDLQSFDAFAKTQIIDVAAAEDAASGNGHGYFIKSPWVSTDLLLTLMYKVNPLGRGLNNDKKENIWEFSDNYSHRIRQIVNEKK
jgi:esterase/lipase superfamily enzyme